MAYIDLTLVKSVIRSTPMKVYTSRKAEVRIKETYSQLLELWNTPVTQLDVAGRYGTTHVNVFGDETLPPLVLFHGVGDDAALMWVYNAAELGMHFRCYAVDTIGGPGLSVPGDGYDASFEDSVWIAELLDALKLSKVYMAGVSNGAYLIQSFMLEHPERVIRGVAMSGSLPIATKKKAMAAMLKVFLPEALFPTDKNVVKLIRKMSGSRYAVFTENPVVFEHFKLLMTGFNRKAMLNHKVRNYDAEAVKTLSRKCLYIEGEEDPFIKAGGESMLQELKDLLAAFKMDVHLVQDAGHGVNHEASSEVNSAIIEYLQKPVDA